MGFIKNLLTPQIPEDIGEVHVEWSFPEYIKQSRSVLWYVSVAVVLALLVVYAIFTQNYLFAVILGLVVFTFVLQMIKTPRQVPVTISQDGIIIGNKFYSYRSFQSFWFIYEPPEFKYLYLGFVSGIKRNVPIPLGDVNPLIVREYLQNYITEDYTKENPEMDDLFGKFLGLH